MWISKRKQKVCFCSLAYPHSNEPVINLQGNFIASMNALHIYSNNLVSTDAPGKKKIYAASCNTQKQLSMCIKSFVDIPAAAVVSPVNVCSRFKEHVS